MNAVQARDEIFGMLWSAWQANAPDASGGDAVPRLLWEDEEPAEPRPQGSPWARATLKHTSGRQASLAGADGFRRYTRSGLVAVQIYGPRDERGSAIAEALAEVAKNAFEGRASPSGAWFRNCRTEEAGPDQGWWRIDALAEFSYDEVR